MYKIIIIAACFVLFFIIPQVSSILLDPGDCVTVVNDTEVCAANTTINVDEECVKWAVENISSSYGNNSERLSGAIDDIESLLASYNETFDAIPEYTSCLADLSDKDITLKMRNKDLEYCNQDKSRLEGDIEDVKATATIEVKKASDNMYTYSAVSFIGGAFLCWFILRKVVPKRLGLETHEPKRGF